MHRTPPPPPVGSTLLGGLLATLVFTALVYAAHPVLPPRAMDPATALARLFDTFWQGGLLVHLALGTLVWPAIFAVTVHPRLPGPPWLRGASFGAVLWLGAELVLVPVAGGGALHAVAGGPAAAAAWLGGYLVYGALLGALAGRREGAPPQPRSGSAGARPTGRISPLRSRPM